MFALLGAVLVARQPQDFLAAQLNAEEGAVFFQEAYNNGFLRSLFTPEAGYYHLLLRLTAGLALLVPLEFVPWVFKAVSFAVQLLPVAYLLADNMAGFVVSPVLRVAVAALYVAGPNASEIYVNATNAQWHLTFAACLILLSAWRSGKARSIADTSLLAVFSLTGPFSLICVPLAAWRWWRDGTLGVDRVRNNGPVIVVIGAVVQATYLLSEKRLAGGPELFAAPTVLETVQIVGLHGTLNSLFGMHALWRWATELPSWVCVAAATLLPVALIEVVRLRNAALAVLAGLAAVSVAVVFLFPLNDPRLWLRPEFGPRYFFFTTLTLLFTLVAMVERGGMTRRIAAPLLAVALVFGIRGDFVVPPLPDNQWRDQIAVFRALPAGASFYIPIYPHQEWGLTLVKKAGPKVPNPVKGLALSQQPLLATLGPVMEVCQADGDSMVVFEGLAVDASTGRPAEGVVLVVDGRLYPTVTGVASQEADSLTADTTVDNAGFYRSIPAMEFGPGLHRVEVWARDQARNLLLKAEPRFLLSSSGTGDASGEEPADAASPL